MNIKKVHYISGIIISLFIGLHLINHLYSLFGAAAHIDLMNNLRIIYRNILAESILLIAVFIQIFSGIKLFLQSRKTVSLFFEKLQIWSGLYLAFFLIIHLSAVLSGRYILNLDTNFWFGAAGLNTFPLNLFFIPYYSLAIISFFGHIASVHSKKNKLDLLGISTNKQSYFILSLGILLAVLILFGLTNSFTGFEIPQEYDIMIGK